MTAARVAELEALPGWAWDRLEDRYQRSLEALRQFSLRNGHLEIPRRHVETFDGEDFKIGSWATSRRVEHRKGALAAERVADLEALPGWKW